MTKCKIQNNHPTLELIEIEGSEGQWWRPVNSTKTRFFNSKNIIIYEGTFKGGTFKGGTFKGGFFKGGTFKGGLFKGGIFEGGTFFFTPVYVTRSDGYVFCVNDLGKTVTAGCRYFTWEEAFTHWNNKRKGTKLQTETLNILEYLEKQSKLLYDNNP